MEDSAERTDPINEIRQLFEEDQKDRQEYTKDPNKGVEIRHRDEQRLTKAKEIVSRGGISDPDELNMLAFIFQHGDTVDDYKKALELTTKAVEMGLPPQNSLIPQATDRLMIQEQLDNGIPLNRLKQKYGTQIRFNETGQEEFEEFGIQP